MSSSVVFLLRVHEMTRRTPRASLKITPIQWLLFKARPMRVCSTPSDGAEASCAKLECAGCLLLPCQYDDTPLAALAILGRSLFGLPNCVAVKAITPWVESRIRAS